MINQKFELTWIFKNDHQWKNWFDSMESISNYVWGSDLIDDQNVICVFVDTPLGDRIFYKGDQK
jgi:hypothetical protein